MKKYAMALVATLVVVALVYAASVVDQQAGAANDDIYYNLKNSSGTLIGRLFYFGANGSGQKGMGIQNVAGDYFGLLNYSNTKTRLGNDNTFQVYLDEEGNWVSEGTDTPSLSTQAVSGDCGTSPSISGNGHRGKVTVGSSTNTGQCRLTFASTRTAQLACSCVNLTSSHGCVAVNPTTTTVDLQSHMSASDVIQYTCTE